MRHSQLDELSNVKYISVLSDSSTDRSVNDNEIVYICYINHKGLPQSLFFGLGIVGKADAKVIPEVIERIFFSRGLIEWKDKMVGFGDDGASVMLGRKGGVESLLIEDVPHMIEIHCVAHRLHAICDHPYISEFDNDLKKIFNFYNKSPKRLGELRDVASLLEDNVRKFGSIHQVRLMASSRGRQMLRLRTGNQLFIIYRMPVSEE